MGKVGIKAWREIKDAAPRSSLGDGKTVTALTEHELSGLAEKDHDIIVGSTNLKSSGQRLTEMPRK